MQELKTLLTVAALAILAGCQTLPAKDPALDAAEREYREAAADPLVQRHAAAELAQVRNMLTRAQSYYSDERNLEQTRHLAYLASAQLSTLRAQSASRDADIQVQQSGAERDRLRLQARDAELQRARSGEDQARRAAAQAQDRASALQRDLAELSAQNTQRGVMVTLRDMLFATGRAELQPGVRSAIERLADVLRQHPERRLLIEGFADSTGNGAMNQRLSQRRAEAVRSALVRAGVAPQRLELRAYGEEYPVADNATAAGRQQNRRVELLFSDEQGRLNYR
ncbi:OmpA family protein [Mitsuaria sp. WAJ17]|uniref:OmpA family protein n=1 Tax=Mitsuaria sp. WAJ17 TaxID=2761452 RepID=UPI0016032895|nr:OmpA family protein [Mitsuaria sp. WAJ17]MBB2485341.1 OmpA family protein [Mitsuaria sp. WAJ17]